MPSTALVGLTDDELFERLGIVVDRIDAAEQARNDGYDERLNIWRILVCQRGRTQREVGVASRLQDGNAVGYALTTHGRDVAD